MAVAGVLLGLVKPKLGDAGEVPQISRDQRKIVMQRCRRDQQVDVPNREPAALKITAKYSETFDNRSIQGKQPLALEKCPEAAQRDLGRAGIARALVELTVGHQADGKAVGRELQQRLDSLCATVQTIDDPVGVDEIRSHRSTEGRVAMAR